MTLIHEELQRAAAKPTPYLPLLRVAAAAFTVAEFIIPCCIWNGWIRL